MTSEKLLIELFNRVKTLEEKVSILEEKVYCKEAVVEEHNLLTNEMKEDTKLTRNTARKYVITKLIENNPKLQISKGNRTINADILITENNDSRDRHLKVKFYHSKSHIEGYVSGWNTIQQEDVENENYNIFIFTVEYKGKLHTFLFLNEELKSFLIGKPMDKSLKYHLYFRIIGDKIIECRDGERDASKYLNRWLLPTEILNEN